MSLPEWYVQKELKIIEKFPRHKDILIGLLERKPALLLRYINSKIKSEIKSEKIYCNIPISALSVQVFNVLKEEFIKKAPVN